MSRNTVGCRLPSFIPFREDIGRILSDITR